MSKATGFICDGCGARAVQESGSGAPLTSSWKAAGWTTIVLYFDTGQRDYHACSINCIGMVAERIAAWSARGGREARPAGRGALAASNECHQTTDKIWRNGAPPTKPPAPGTSGPKALGSGLAQRRAKRARKG